MEHTAEGLRSVDHANGVFSFLIPRHWAHEVEDDGTQVFWDEGDGSGTLRVTSITAKKDADPDLLPQVGLLSKGVTPTVRDDGVAWVHYRRNEEEDGESTVMFWWEFAQFVPPRNVRVAFFSFTIYASEENEPATKVQLNMLRQLPSFVTFGELQDFER
jgi:hypothetical protein